jgi:hypothetical protein
VYIPYSLDQDAVVKVVAKSSRRAEHQQSICEFRQSGRIILFVHFQTLGMSVPAQDRGTDADWLAVALPLAAAFSRQSRTTFAAVEDLLTAETARTKALESGNTNSSDDSPTSRYLVSATG